MAKRRRKKNGINPEDTVKAKASTKISKDTFTDRTKTTVLEDIQWVSEHLPIPGITMEDAPSARAWDWYKRYHGSQAKRSTFDNLFMGQLAKAASNSGQSRFHDEEKEHIKKLDEFEDTSQKVYEHVLPTQEPDYASANV